MLPGTFSARRHAALASPALLSALTLFQAAAVLVLGAIRPAIGVSLAVLAVMAFANGWRSMLAGALGMDAAPEDKLAVMSMRAAANQFGYLLGAAAGGLALEAGGFAGLGAALAGAFVAATLVHDPMIRLWRGSLRSRRVAAVEAAP
jgi:predicted MFS family arabinose efflux permease